MCHIVTCSGGWGSEPLGVEGGRSYAVLADCSTPLNEQSRVAQPYLICHPSVGTSQADPATLGAGITGRQMCHGADMLCFCSRLNGICSISAYIVNAAALHKFTKRLSSHSTFKRIPKAISYSGSHEWPALRGGDSIATPMRTNRRAAWYGGTVSCAHYQSSHCRTPQPHL